MGRSFKDITGQRVGRLVALKFDSRAMGVTYWRCKCDCGNTVVIQQSRFSCMNTMSCGCLKSEGNNFKHGETKKGGEATKEYRAWLNMKMRCCNTKNKSYKDYGGRGVTICKRWLHSYHNFLADVGRAPGFKYSIDRINNDGNYTPSNVRWATALTQRHNQRRVIQCA